ncbi:MAG: hypothetical protein AAFO75_08495 [Pseudomonadota bacterium]
MSKSSISFGVFDPHYAHSADARRAPLRLAAKTALHSSRVAIITQQLTNGNRHAT